MRLHRFDPPRLIVWMNSQRREPLGGIVAFRSGREPKDLARARRCKHAARRRDSWRVNSASKSAANAPSASVRAPVPSACSRHGASATAASRDTRTIIEYSGTSFSATKRSTPSTGLTIRIGDEAPAARDASS